MLTNLQQQPADALLALIKLHNDDPRADKIDLGVGVYKTGQGDTPVFASIKAAERILVETQGTKAYLGPEGDMGFVEKLMPYVFGKSDPTMGGRIEGMQTPGGTGSLRLALAVIKKAQVKRIWMGVPSWPNHAQICADLGLELKTFNHATPEGTADIDALRAAIAAADEGDAFLFQSCCHNPTGIDYTDAHWDEIAGLVAGKQILPLLDLAYQGLGKGWEEDAYGMRRVLAAAGRTGGVDLTPIGGQNGLFSIIPFTPEQVQAMRADHGIYFAGSGRINVAGLTTGNIAQFIAAVAKVTG